MDPSCRCGPDRSPGIPRARGDGPAGVDGRGPARMDSPRSRGWTPGVDALAGRGPGFPALAGMDPRRRRPRRPRPRIPRARGDGPLAGRGRTLARGDSPRSRGWTHAYVGLIREHRGFPALAGMDPSCRAPHHRGGGIPRARGDGPRPRPVKKRRPKDSPRSRGWTRRRRRRAGRPRGFPALAGMDPVGDVSRDRWRRIPRARGDGPRLMTLRHWCETDSPRSRGWTRPSGPAPLRPLGFPALAGMDRRPRA